MSMAQAHSAATPPAVRECWWRFGSTAIGRRQWVGCQARVLGTVPCGAAGQSLERQTSRSLCTRAQSADSRRQEQDHDTRRMGEDAGRGSCCAARRLIGCAEKTRRCPPRRPSIPHQTPEKPCLRSATTMDEFPDVKQLRPFNCAPTAYCTGALYVASWPGQSCCCEVGNTSYSSVTTREA